MQVFHHSRVHGTLAQEVLLCVVPHGLKPAFPSKVGGVHTVRKRVLVSLGDKVLQDLELIPDLVHVRHCAPQQVDQLLVISLVEGHVMFQGWVEPFREYM